MIIIKSKRANEWLLRPRAFKTDRSPGMRRYPGEGYDLEVEIEWDQERVKNLSFYGEVVAWKKIILESMASLMVGKEGAKLGQLSLRECEAFLRDRNSELALEGIPQAAEVEFKALLDWISTRPRIGHGQEYHFSSEKGPFSQLKLVDKVRELKAFLSSAGVQELYQGHPFPELIDVEDLTVYIDVQYQSDKERSLFEELHILGVETFQEESLNFIPEA